MTLSPQQLQAKRDSYLRRTYGITLDQYGDLLERQGRGCALCKKTPEDEGKNLAVDHNHATGEIRGLLCSYCNHRVIGKHRDSDLLLRMAEYVSKGTGLFVPEKVKRAKRRIRKSRDPLDG